MISKIAQTAGALMMISSVNGFMYQKKALDKRSVSFDEKLGCAMCIQNGYSFVYKALIAAKTNAETVAASGSYATSVTTNSVAR